MTSSARRRERSTRFPPRISADIAAETFEIIVVDNGSRVPVDATLLASLSGNFRLLRIDDAPASPAYAINCGLRAARGEVVGVMTDGARIATPGLLHCALRGARLYDDAIVATLGWYLGHDFQGTAMQYGYDREREDALLDSIAWPSDGYRLFEIGTMDESSIDGWFAPIAESNAVFARRSIWERLDGVDERFDLPGGGLLNCDTFDRLLGVSGALARHSACGGDVPPTPRRYQHQRRSRSADREFQRVGRSIRGDSRSRLGAAARTRNHVSRDASARAAQANRACCDDGRRRPPPTARSRSRLRSER